MLHTQPIFGMLSTDFHKNRQKIPILSMLNSRLKCPGFHEMGISTRLNIARPPIGMHVCPLEYLMEGACASGLNIYAISTNVSLKVFKAYM